MLDLFTRFLGTGFDAMSRIRLSQGQRRELLRAVIAYYAIHLPGFREPRSLDVLDAVFA